MQGGRRMPPERPCLPTFSLLHLIAIGCQGFAAGISDGRSEIAEVGMCRARVRCIRGIHAPTSHKLFFFVKQMYRTR